MIFNLVSASNTILSCFLLFFLIIDLYFLIPVVVLEIFIVIAKLAIPTGIQNKEARTKIETGQVTVEAKINKCSV